MRLFLCIAGLLFSYIIQAQPVTAKSWLVANSEGKVIAGENTEAVRSIASITKLITVITVLDSHAPLDTPLSVKRKITQKKKTKEISTPYDESTRRQLIELAMVRSDNQAAKLLCDTFPGGYNECILTMNHKVASLGMTQTKMFDPTGLDDRNVSTATDLIKLATAAIKYPEVVAASQLSQIKVKIKKRWFHGRNTNPLIGDKHIIQVSKTGWTTKSGGCIVMLMDTDQGRRVVVVLGSKNTQTRIPEAEFLSQIDDLTPDEPKEVRRWGNWYWLKID
jgi:serine-type D-Ala-D-Ala endopeptidase (penicillin-binding protein 7)